MKIVLSVKAEKSLKRFSRIDQIIISKKIRQLKEPHITQEEKIKSSQHIFRVRVGNYRVVYRKTPQEIYIVLIAHRKDVYGLIEAIIVSFARGFSTWNIPSMYVVSPSLGAMCYSGK